MGAIYRSSDETGFGGLFQQGKTTVGSSVLLHIMDNTFVELMTIYHGRDLLEPWYLAIYCYRAIIANIYIFFLSFQPFS
jgi:hypothetical protein